MNGTPRSRKSIALRRARRPTSAHPGRQKSLRRTGSGPGASGALVGGVHKGEDRVDRPAEAGSSVGNLRTMASGVAPCWWKYTTVSSETRLAPTRAAPSLFTRMGGISESSGRSIITAILPRGLAADLLRELQLDVRRVRIV